MATLADFSQWLESLPATMQPTAAELYQVANKQVERIKNRTAQGISSDGTPFAPYSKNTKKSPPVNLFDTGDMLGNIQVLADEREAVIFFSDSRQAEKAGYHNSGTSRMPQRHFFGVSLQDRDEIMSDIRSAVFMRVNG